MIQDDPSSGIPWGRPSIPAIPLPPFADRRAAVGFVEQLCVYVAMLGGDGPVQPPTFGLLTVLQREFDIVRWASELQPLPSPTVVTSAMVTYFPAPWTPHGLNDVLHRVLGTGGVPTPPRPGTVGWGSDPGFVGRRSDAGDWTVTASERGTDTVVGRFTDDEDMVLYRMSFLRSHPMPFGWGWNTAHRVELDRAAGAARSAWTPHARLPYIADWRH